MFLRHRNFMCDTFSSGEAKMWIMFGSLSLHRQLDQEDDKRGSCPNKVGLNLLW